VLRLVSTVEAACKCSLRTAPAGCMTSTVQKFPQRTLVLMVLALLAFGWFFVSMHRVTAAKAAPPSNVQPVQLIVAPGGDR
jgi:hypothetical protein